MKNVTKRIIAIFAVLCVAATSLASCGDKKKKEDTEAMTRYPLEIGIPGDGNAISIDDPNSDLDAPDPVGDTTEAPAEPVTEIQEVTDAEGQPVTEIAEVTDANGETVKDENDQPVTEVVKVTTVVTKPAPTEAATTKADNNYTPANDGRYAMWIDISQDENFYFEGDMLKVKFKVKNNIPDGDYRVRISPDLSDIAGVAISPSKVIDGIIRVNNGAVEPIDLSGETGMVFYGDNIACKQGDDIEFNINIKNNSGLAAFVIWFYFDSNALEYVDAKATGEFKEIANATEVGKRGESN